MKNLNLYRNTNTAAVTAQLSCSQDILCDRSVTANAFVSTSDRSIKQNIQDADLDACMDLFHAVEVKTYQRTDVAGERIGYIAQDVQQNQPAQFGNLVHTTYRGDTSLLALDYPRLSCVLWGVVKKLEQRLLELEAV